MQNLHGLAEDRGSRTHPRTLASLTGFEILPPHRKRRSSFVEISSTLA